MKNEQTSTKDELNLREVARFLQLDYKKLAQDGQVKQLFETGISKAMPVKVQAGNMEGKAIDFSTTARLAIGTNKEGKPTVNVVFKNAEPSLDRYRDINLNPAQQQDLQKGKTLVVKDTNQQEHLIKFDQELNRVAGMKKSIFLAPEQLGSPRMGYTKLDDRQQADLKQGRAIEVEIGGKKVTAQLDPIERRLNVSQGPKQGQEIKQDSERKISRGPTL